MPERPRAPRPAPLSLEGAAEVAPPEAVRAVAALLGRVAAPRRIDGSAPVAPINVPEPQPPTPVVQAPEPQRATTALADIAELAADFAVLEGGDREIPIDGLGAEVRDVAARETRRAAKRLRRARREVREVLERLSTLPEDEIGG